MFWVTVDVAESDSMSWESEGRAWEWAGVPRQERPQGFAGDDEKEEEKVEREEEKEDEKDELGFPWWIDSMKL